MHRWLPRVAPAEGAAPAMPVGARSGVRVRATARAEQVRESATLRWWGALATITAAAALGRVGYVLLARGRAPSADGFAYSSVGSFVAAGEGFRNPMVDLPTALHPPGWSAVLALASAVGVDTILGHQLIAALVGATTVTLVGILGRRLGGASAGLVAAGLAALHPSLWVWERELASETLLLALVAATLVVVDRHVVAPARWTPVALGVLAGLLALTRTEQAALLFVLVVPVVVLAGHRSIPWPRRWAWAGLAVAAALLVVAPWVVYNQDRFAEPVGLSTGAGVTLRYAYNPTTYDGDRLGYGDPATWSEVRLGDESQVDVSHRQEAWRFVRSDPGRLPAVVAARQGRTWGFYRPLQQSRLDQEWGNSPRGAYLAGWALYAALLPLAGVGAVLLARRGRSPLPLLSVVLVAAGYAALTYGQPRYRVTADLVIVVLAAVAIAALGEAAGARRWARGRRPDDP